MGELLNSINSPKDLKKLSMRELEALAKEAREEIIRVVTTVTGGHLGANLGSVELTLALHYVFDTPRDRIFFDVGHQVYTHKLITGRRDRIDTLRQYKGLYGFTRRGESEYDLFTTAHAGTSISTSLGMVEAREHQGGSHKVVAVIGDGALTAGLAYEGLNNAGHLNKDFVVVLNDNKMSIAPNVGAISTYLSRVLTGRLYVSFRKEFKHLLNQMPGGSVALRAAKKFEEAMKTLISPGVLFEELGFIYVGPVEGHNIAAMVETFQNIKAFKQPVLVHLLTEKGKGYQPAEENRVKYHGVTAKKVLRAGSKTRAKPPKPSPPNYTKVFAKALIELAQEDERIIGVTAAMPDGTGLDEFAKIFPDRFYDVGIAEQHAVAFSAGLASEGMKPVAAIYSTFLQRAYDQIFHEVCLQNLPVTFALDRAGLVGEDGPTHHGVFDLTYLRAFPHMVIMSPKDENELRHLLKTAIEYPGPAAVRFPRGSGPGVPLDPTIHSLEVGRGEVLREGNDLCFLALGNRVYPSLEAAEILAREGIEAGVVNMRFAKPIDANLVEEAARRVGRIVTVEENTIRGGFGSAVLECLVERNLLGGISVKCLGIQDTFTPHGAPAILRKLEGLDPEGIAEAGRSLVSSRSAVPPVLVHEETRAAR
jgi:1-deoxy-D-xylulose-5-phosphate synthase